MFEEKEKRIFGYDFDGKKMWADPLAVRRAMLRHSGGRYAELRKDAIEPEEEDGEVSVRVESLAQSLGLPVGTVSEEQKALDLAHRASAKMSALAAQEQLADCVRAGFALPAFDPATGEGADESTCWKILREFDEWLEKNARGAGN